MKLVNFLFIGDVFGSIGRKVLHTVLPEIKKQYNIHFVICNSENVSHGNGLSVSHYKFLQELGCNCLTSGNHFLGNKQVVEHPEFYSNQIRPMNFVGNYPLDGSKLFNCNGVNIRVTNLIGNSYIYLSQDNCFSCFEKFLKTLNNEKSIHIVDFHAEATGEKRAFAEMFDGKINAVLGTHTHVQTADEQILNKGTLFMTDVGLTGSSDSILGCDKNAMILRSAYGLRSVVNPIEKGPSIFNALYFTVDADTGKIEKFERINKKINI